MDACSIREANLIDAPAIAHLITQLGYPTSSDEMEDRLRILLTRPDYITFIAEVSDTVVGLVGATLGYAIEFTGSYGRLTGLIVDEHWRGRGIGTRLIKHIESWLREQGVTLVILTSNKQRIEAHQFYRTLGYADTGLRFMKRLT